MINFNGYTTKEIFLLMSTFSMLLILVLHDQLISPFIALFFISSIPFWKGQFSKVGKLLALLLIAFYLLHLIGMLHSINLSYGRADLMTKLSYFLFPLCIFLIRKGYALILKGIKWGLIIGSLISMLISLVFAVVQEGGFTGNSFNSSIYGFNMHPSYLSLLFIISGAFVLKLKKDWKLLFWIKVIYTCLVIMSIFYLRSLGAFVCIASVFCILPVWSAIKKRNWKWYLILPAYGIIFYAGINSSDRIENDINKSWVKLSEWKHSPEKFLLNNKNVTESNTIRLVTWTLSSRIVVDNPLGVGTGDVKEVLEVYYRSYGYTNYAHHKYNPHNQFLQTGIALGWPGIILLFVLFISMLVLTYKLNDVVAFIASLCIFVSCFFESMLERQVGVILTCILLVFVIFNAVLAEERERGLKTSST